MSLGWGWSWGRTGSRDEVGVEDGIGGGGRARVAVGDGVGDEVGLEVEFGGESEFRVKARTLGTRRGGPATQPHLVWEVPVQPLGPGQCGLGAALAVAVHRVAQLEAFCGQSELCTNAGGQRPALPPVHLTGTSWTRPFCAWGQSLRRRNP